MRFRFWQRNQGPVPPRGQNKAVIPLYLLRDSDPLPNKIPRSPAFLLGNQPNSINPNLPRQFWPAAGEPDPDSYPFIGIPLKFLASLSNKTRRPKWKNERPFLRQGPLDLRIF